MRAASATVLHTLETKHFQFVCENSHLFICTHAKTLLVENLLKHVRRSGVRHRIELKFLCSVEIKFLWRIDDTKPPIEREVRWHEERYVGTISMWASTIKVNTDIRTAQHSQPTMSMACTANEAKKERKRNKQQRQPRHSMMICEMRLCVNYSLSTCHFSSFLFIPFPLCLLLLHFSDAESSSLVSRSAFDDRTRSRNCSLSLSFAHLHFIPQLISTLIIIKVNARIRLICWMKRLRI